jgi:hypothetical protein
MNSSHYVAGTNMYSMKLNPALDTKGRNAKISVKNCAIHNSSYNISADLGNNTFSIIWINSERLDVTIPDGYYSFDDLNSYLQYVMTSKKWYIRNTSSSNPVQSQFFISFKANFIRYTTEIGILYVPSEMPSGFAYPVTETNEVLGWTLPTVPKYPQIILSSKLMKLFGFKTTSIFPSNTDASLKQNITYVSDTYPVLNDTFSYVLSCNMVNNPYSRQADALHMIPLTAAYGGLIDNNPATTNWLSIYESQYTELQIMLYNQDFKPFVPLDPELSLTLIIELDE